MNRQLYCVAHGHADEWEAFCLDLDLAVQGRSFEEVRRLLHEVIHSYLEDVSKLPEADRRRLLSRSVPWHVRMLWYWRIAISRLWRSNREDGSTIDFPVPCPA